MKVSIQGEVMSTEYDALYDAKRDARESWKGYQYQGEYALLRYLERLVEQYEMGTEKSDIQDLTVCVEWIEDFNIFQGGKLKEIYQIKKDLNETDRTEVLQNFIFQFKVLKSKEIKWILGYSTTGLKEDKLKCGKTEFDIIYADYIEKGWLYEIKQLEDNVGEKGYWQDNLNLMKKESTCKTIRRYVRKMVEPRDYEKSIDERQRICREILDPLKQKLKRTATDYQEFSKVLSFENIPMLEIHDRCIEKIEFLVKELPAYQLLTSDSAKALLSYDFQMKMGKLQKDKAIFKYKFSELKEVLSNWSDAKLNWIQILDSAKIEMEELKKELCESCDHTVPCEKCILDIVGSMDMQMLFDNLNLNLAPYSAENAIASFRDKASSEKIQSLVNILFEYKNKIVGKNSSLLCDLEDSAVSVISNKKTGTMEKVIHKKIHKGLLENFWKHICVYQDHERVLTENFDYTLSESDLTILKECGEKEEIPNFNTIRPVTFMDYEGNLKKYD